MLTADATYYEKKTLGFRMRQRRFARFRRILEAVHARRGRVDIVDLGGTETYWLIAGDALERFNCRVHVINPALPEAPSDPRFTFERGDATALAHLADGSFDVVHSNSVIEHVGAWWHMRAFAEQVRRLAPAYFVQTPNFWFPVEPHFRAPLVHWLPEPLRARLLMTVHLGFAEDKQRDMDAAMRRVHGITLLDGAQMGALFPDARIERERLGPFAKSLIAVREADAA